MGKIFKFKKKEIIEEKNEEKISTQRDKHPSLYERVRDVWYASQVKDIENIEILEVTWANEYDFFAKLKIENKLYLAYLAYDKFQLTPIE